MNVKSSQANALFLSEQNSEYRLINVFQLLVHPRAHPVTFALRHHPVLHLGSFGILRHKAEFYPTEQ